MLKNYNQVKTKIKIANKNNNNKLEQSNLKDKKDFLFVIE